MEVDRIRNIERRLVVSGPYRPMLGSKQDGTYRLPGGLAVRELMECELECKLVVDLDICQQMKIHCHGP